MSGLCRSLVKRDGHRQNASERVRGPARTLWRKRLPVPVNRSNSIETAPLDRLLARIGDARVVLAVAPFETKTLAEMPDTYPFGL